ncbi:hypothetical protein GJ496_007495 [Pomphorhynchus laevis]|nr:hypothetical protein GJ496_007495 [Pomphorhynchus laevis]
MDDEDKPKRVMRPLSIKSTDKRQKSNNELFSHQPTVRNCRVAPSTFNSNMHQTQSRFNNYHHSNTALHRTRTPNLTKNSGQLVI